MRNRWSVVCPSTRCQVYSEYGYLLLKSTALRTAISVSVSLMLSPSRNSLSHLLLTNRSFLRDLLVYRRQAKLRRVQSLELVGRALVTCRTFCFLWKPVTRGSGREVPRIWSEKAGKKRCVCLEDEKSESGFPELNPWARWGGAGRTLVGWRGWQVFFSSLAVCLQFETEHCGRWQSSGYIS